MSPVKTSHIGSPELQNRERYRRPSKTSGTPHVNRFVTFPPCRGHRGKHVENQTHHQGDTGAQESAVFWEPWGAPLLPKNRVCIFFIQSNLALFPNDKFCRFLTKRSCLVMRKTSRPYEMVFRHGRPREHSTASQCRCTGWQCSVPRGTSRKTLSILPRVSL